MQRVIPAAALDQHIAILGKTGSGKTYAAKGLVEWMLGEKRQVVVIDPTAAWWGLRLDKDGKRKGADVVLLGGEHADFPAPPKSGEAIARLATEKRASIVVDTSEMGVGEYTRWFAAFAGTLFKTIRSPLHLVIDEAHFFMPQSQFGRDPGVTSSLSAGNRLMSSGRGKGIRGMLITQRPAALHKHSLTCADTLIAMRVLAPQDRQAIKDWIIGCGDPVRGKKVIDSLASLKAGHGWAWYPDEGFLSRLHFPRINTYDSSATPKHGANRAVKIAELKRSDVASALDAYIKEAAENDPKTLRRRIAELERAAAKTGGRKSPEPPSGKEVDDAVRAAVVRRDDAWRERWEEASSQAEDAVRTNAAEIVRNHMEAPLRPPKETPAPRSASKPLPAVPRNRPSVPHARESAATTAAEANGCNIGKNAHSRMLAALAAAGGTLSVGKMCALARTRRRSRTYSNSVSTLRTAGYVTDDGSSFTATAAGIEAIGDYETLPTGAALRAHWQGQLGNGAPRRMFDLLCGMHPHAWESAALRAEMGGGDRTFSNAVSRLRTLELITGKTELVASDELFD